jgi:hypothetical protein
MSTPQDKGSRCHGACTGACLDRHACQTGRQSWSARPGSSGTALTRGARSGSLHVSREVGLPALLAYQRRQLPTLVGGLRRVWPRRLVGLFLHESGPSGGPGFTPPSEAPEWLCGFDNRGAAGLGLMTPGRGVPSARPRSQLSAGASAGMTES